MTTVHIQKFIAAIHPTKQATLWSSWRPISTSCLTWKIYIYSREHNFPAVPTCFLKKQVVCTPLVFCWRHATFFHYYSLRTELYFSASGADFIMLSISFLNFKLQSPPLKKKSTRELKKTGLYEHGKQSNWKLKVADYTCCELAVLDCN